MKLKLLKMDIRYEHDVVLARQRARSIAAALKFDVQAQTRIATAVSEVVRNAFQYAGGGSIDFEIENGSERMLLMSVRDNGIGIPNLDEILGGKYVSKTGMGLGIIGAKRLLDHFQIESNKSSGTVVVLGKVIPERFTRLSDSELNALLATVDTSQQKILTRSSSSRIKSSCGPSRNCERGSSNWRSSTGNWMKRTGAS